MQIYIAAPYEHRSAAVKLADTLVHRGFSLCSRWLTPAHDADGKNSPLGDVPASHALDDVEDVLACDVLVALNPPLFARSGTGGRHVEFGIAVARSKRVILVGERTNVFHFLPSVVHVPAVGASGLSDTLVHVLNRIARADLGSRL